MGIYIPPPGQHTAVVKAALQTVLADHYADEGDPHADAMAEYCDDRLALASLALVHAVDELPPDQRPSGWPDAALIDRIKQVINASGVDRAVLAAELPKLGAALAGRRRFSSTELAVIAERCRVAVGWLLGIGEPETTGSQAADDTCILVVPEETDEQRLADMEKDARRQVEMYRSLPHYPDGYFRALDVLTLAGELRRQRARFAERPVWYARDGAGWFGPPCVDAETAKAHTEQTYREQAGGGLLCWEVEVHGEHGSWRLFDGVNDTGWTVSVDAERVLGPDDVKRSLSS